MADIAWVVMDTSKELGIKSIKKITYSENEAKTFLADYITKKENEHVRGFNLELSEIEIK